MTEKMKVKVIKKTDVKPAEPRPSLVKKSKQRAARQVVSTVTNWVSDFQHRKRDETKLAIEQLFSSPRPSES